MINVSNYFVASKATFQEVAPKIVEHLLESLSIEIPAETDVTSGNTVYYLKEQPSSQDIMMNGKTWTLNFVSVSRWGSVSVYFTDGDRLLRISDHWSKGSMINNCGNIRNCYWSFKKARNSKLIAWRGRSLQAGIVAFSNMQPC